jgi:hypothetical protein
VVGIAVGQPFPLDVDAGGRLEQQHVDDAISRHSLGRPKLDSFSPQGYLQIRGGKR